MIYTPRPYQPAMTQFMLDHKRLNLYAGMGTGKTPATLEALAVLFLAGAIKRVLVIAPLRVATSVWPAECEKWDCFQHLSIACAVGTPKQRMAALLSGSDIVTTNFENLSWLIQMWGSRWDFDTVVCDESVKLKSFRGSFQTNKATGKRFVTGQGGVRAKALARVAHSKVKRWINLCGTPAPNGLKDIWGQVWYVDGGERLGNTFTAFKDRWFQSIPVGEGFKLEPFKNSEKEIHDAIRDITLSVEGRDHFKLSPLIESTIRCELPSAAWKVYKDMEKELFAALEDGEEVEAFNAAARCSKCLQISSGAVYTSPEHRMWSQVHDAKIEALRDVVEEAAGMPVMVSFQFRHDCERILKAFPQAKQLSKDPAMIRDWNAGKIPMLVLHPLSGGHGLSLQDGGNILCDFSSGYDLDPDAQILERIGPTRQAQSGYDRPVYRIRLVGARTIEETAVLPVLAGKATVNAALIAAMKGRT